MGTLKPLAIMDIKGTEKSRSACIQLPESQMHHCPLFVGRMIRHNQERAFARLVATTVRALGCAPSRRW
jgi:hypothetical protein